jgi:ribosome-binding factor A
MANDGRRQDRVAESIREQVATFLADSAKDPRITGMVTVTGVEVTRDLRHARIFVSIMGGDAARASTLEGLKSLAAHLRSKLGRSLRIHSAPELEFRLDPSIAHAARIETLLAQIKDGKVDPNAASDLD